MCQYSATDGLGDDWHVQHLGARAMGGAGIVFTEATHVSAVGRITHHCLGLWNSQHQALLARLAAIISRGGAVPGIQLAHAGRKASTTRTWEGSKPIAPHDGGWVPVAPSPIAFHPGAVDPHALIADIAGQFANRVVAQCFEALQAGRSRTSSTARRFSHPGGVETPPGPSLFGFRFLRSEMRHHLGDEQLERAHRDVVRQAE